MTDQTNTVQSDKSAIYDDLETLRQAAQILSVHAPHASQEMLEVSRILWSSVAEGGDVSDQVRGEAADLAEQLTDEGTSAVADLPETQRDELVDRLSRLAEEVDSSTD